MSAQNISSSPEGISNENETKHLILCPKSNSTSHHQTK